MKPTERLILPYQTVARFPLRPKGAEHQIRNKGSVLARINSLNFMILSQSFILRHCKPRRSSPGGGHAKIIREKPYPFKIIIGVRLCLQGSK